MEWHHLEYFKHLAKSENITATAKAMNISQSALSRAIQQLEKHLTVPLFNRIGRSIKLNKYGVAFLETTQNITQEMELFQSKVKRATDALSGEIIIGFLHSVGPTYLSEFLKQFRQQYPEIQVKLVQNHAYNLFKMLDNGDIDIAITTISNKTTSTNFVPLLEEELYLTVNSNHALAQQSTVDITNVSNEKFILLKQGFVLREQVDEILNYFNLDVEINFEGEETLTVASFVSSGLGVSILPHMKNIQLPNLTQLPIRNYHARRTIGVSYKGKNDILPIIKTTKNSLVKYFQSYNDD
ncbi:LysR family transcriptional regulator [Staphylococcus arlettae]|uniref:Transcriptional regulator n=1 Tax=Staphylococcus arlettae TaxID=29378 RepID=A0A380BWR0_9STAP|nr:LysR family transcriptional regulator [Staphylococcus arlettae]PNZ54443.1 LysR family transcriptional regulator [Staphylococcus arlettae]GEQ00315.1 putative HTH-type transcriptional regulator YybE [Staphylococcus arlettae]SUJ08441.1 transcriptional regulator [Staphylococcus arlettae]